MLVAASAFARTAAFSGKTTTGTDSTSVGQSTQVMSLVYFKATPSAEKVELTWGLASELNFDYFNIEKSEDGVQFYSIGKVQGHGASSTVQTYQLEDTTPAIGRSFYRISYVKADKHAETFQLVMVNRKAK